MAAPNPRHHHFSQIMLTDEPGPVQQSITRPTIGAVKVEPKKSDDGGMGDLMARIA